MPIWHFKMGSPGGIAAEATALRSQFATSTEVVTIRDHFETQRLGDWKWNPSPESHRDLLFRRQRCVCYTKGARKVAPGAGLEPALCLINNQVGCHYPTPDWPWDRLQTSDFRHQEEESSVISHPTSVLSGADGATRTRIASLRERQSAFDLRRH